MSERESHFDLIITALRTGDELSGADISHKAELGPGHLYPTLKAMEHLRLIESRWEDGSYPRRRLYRLVKDATNEKPRRVG